MLGVTLRWTSIPSRGSRNIPSYGNRDKLQQYGLLRRWGRFARKRSQLRRARRNGCFRRLWATWHEAWPFTKWVCCLFELVSQSEWKLQQRRLMPCLVPKQQHFPRLALHQSCCHTLVSRQYHRTCSCSFTTLPQWLELMQHRNLFFWLKSSPLAPSW